MAGSRFSLHHCTVLTALIGVPVAGFAMYLSWQIYHQAAAASVPDGSILAAFHLAWAASLLTLPVVTEVTARRAVRHWHPAPLHLSTCAALMLIAGVLVWANFLPRNSFQQERLVHLPTERRGFQEISVTEVEYKDFGAYGWPCTAIFPDVKTSTRPPVSNAPPQPPDAPSDVTLDVQYRTDWWSLLTDLLSALLALGFTGFICERDLRRRALAVATLPQSQQT